MKFEHFEDLEVWKLGIELYRNILKITCEVPFANDYKLKDQIRASSGSVSDNIAEGFERGGNKEFIQFLYIAKGSCGESRNQCYRAYYCGYISQETLDELLKKTTELSQQICNFIKYLRDSNFKGEKFHNL